MKSIKSTALPVSAITAVLLSFALLLASCAGAGAGGGGADAPQGTITLNFGGESGNARAAAPANGDIPYAELTHTVQLKGAAALTATAKQGDTKLSISAPAGIYTLTVTATRNGVLFAEGTTTNVKIEAGKTTSVGVKMTLADGTDGGTITIETTFTSITDFEAWLKAQPGNLSSKPYNVKLNISGELETDNSNLLAKTKLGNVLLANGNKFVSLDLSGSTFTKLEEYAFYMCHPLSGKIILPNTVTYIDKYAFEACVNITDINIPNGVTSIGDSAFTGLAITSITIPGSVTSIGLNAFYGCSNLTTVTFAAGSSISTASFGNNAFPEVDPTLGTTGSGNTLKTAYNNIFVIYGYGEGTYTRAANGTTWSKQ